MIEPLDDRDARLPGPRSVAMPLMDSGRPYRRKVWIMRMWMVHLASLSLICGACATYSRSRLPMSPSQSPGSSGTLEATPELGTPQSDTPDSEPLDGPSLGNPGTASRKRVPLGATQHTVGYRPTEGAFGPESFGPPGRGYIELPPPPDME